LNFTDSGGRLDHLTINIRYNSQWLLWLNLIS
jgi:hypothetical protein